MQSVGTGGSEWQEPGAEKVETSSLFICFLWDKSMTKMKVNRFFTSCLSNKHGQRAAAFSINMIVKHFVLLSINHMEHWRRTRRETGIMWCKNGKFCIISITHISEVSKSSQKLAWASSLNSLGLFGFTIWKKNERWESAYYCSSSKWHYICSFPHCRCH